MTQKDEAHRLYNHHQIKHEELDAAAHAIFRRKKMLGEIALAVALVLEMVPSNRATQAIFGIVALTAILQILSAYNIRKAAINGTLQDNLGVVTTALTQREKQKNSQLKVYNFDTLALEQRLDLLKKDPVNYGPWGRGWQYSNPKL